MTKSKSTKRALLVSMISLVLCCAMLVGTTFAWFTDSVTSGKNTIVAGNLDVEAEYKDGEVWKTLEGAESIFSKDSLWEPGHTEYAVIRIKNAGTLALKYQVKIDVVSETGSINVNGNAFKLSDYLKYGITTSITEPNITTRDDAASAATTTLGAYTSTDKVLLAGSDYDYLTLAITMPTTVGNDANYDKAYNAPYIELGISILATQTPSESDSFGNDYDQNATYPAPTFTSTSTVVFPVTATGTVVGDSSNDVTLTLTATTTNDETYTVGTVTVPASAINDENTVTVTIEPTESGNFTAVADDKEAKYYEITVEGLKENNTQNITVTLQLDPGLTDVVVKHYDEEKSQEETLSSTYDSTTGKVTFTTTSFSPFAVEYKSEKVAKIGEQYYSSLADAAAAAKDGDTITLEKSVEGSGVVIDTSKYASSGLTIDLGGNTYTVTDPTVGSAGTETNGFQLLKGGKVTFKNGTLVAGTSSARILIQNYCDLTLTDVHAVGNTNTLYVVSNNNGNTVFNGNTSITATEGNFAFDAYYNPTAYGTVTVTVNTTGTITGKIEKTMKTGQSLKDGDEHEIYISNGTFQVGDSDTLSTVLNALTENNTAKIVLTGDISMSSNYTVSKNVSIDLSSNTLSYTGSESWLTVKGGAKLTINDGALVANSMNKSNTGVICAEGGSSVTLDGVAFTTNGAALYPKGDATSITVKKSTIVGGAYAIATNAGTAENYGVVINVTDSTLTTNNSTVIVNIPCTLNMTNTTVNGAFHGVIIRGGTATLTGCTVNNTVVVDKDDNYLHYFDNRDWGTGNTLTLGALVFGNKNSSSYQYPTTVTLINTKVTSGSKHPAIYGYGNSGNSLGAILTYDGECVITGDIISGNEYATINGQSNFTQNNN